MSATREPGPLLRRWEALPGAVQFPLAFAVFGIVMFVGHITLLNQPLGRAVFYGIFWGAVLAIITLLATRNEMTKRQYGDQADHAE